MRRGAAARRRKAVKQRNRAAQHDEELESENLLQREEESQEHIESPAQQMAHRSFVPSHSPPASIASSTLEMKLVPHTDTIDLATERLDEPDLDDAGEDREDAKLAIAKKDEDDQAPTPEAEEGRREAAEQIETDDSGTAGGKEDSERRSRWSASEPESESEVEDPAASEETDLEADRETPIGELEAGGGSNPEDGSDAGSEGTAPAAPAPPGAGGNPTTGRSPERGLKNLAKADSVRETAESIQPEFEASAEESRAEKSQRRQADRERKRVKRVTGRFMKHHASKAKDLSDLAQAIPQQFQDAAKTAIGQVQSSMDQQCKSIDTHYGGLKKEASSHAGKIRKAILSQKTAALNQLKTSSTAAAVELSTGHGQVLNQLMADREAQITRVTMIYQQYQKQYRDTGTEIGAQAMRLAEKKATGWEGQKDPDHPDNTFLNGPVHDNRMDARASSARTVGKGYRDGYVSQGADQAAASMEGLPADIATIQQLSAKTESMVLEVYTQLDQQLREYAESSEADATAKADTILGELDRQLEAYLTRLDTEAAGRKEQVRAYGERQVGAIQTAADDASAALTEGAATALDEYTQELEGIGQAISELEGHPDPDELQSQLDEASASLDSAQADVLSQLEAALGEGMLNVQQGGVDASGAVSELGKNALEQSSASQEVFIKQLDVLETRSAETFSTLTLRHAEAIAAVTAGAHEQYADLLNRGMEVSEMMAVQIDQAFSQSAENFQTGLEKHLNKELEPKIDSEAKKAADKVQPRWKSVLKVLAVIAVVVLITIVAGPAVIGAVGALAAQALGAGALATAIGVIVGGAAVGAVAGAAGTIVGNLIDGKDDVFEGVGKSMLTGAIGGAFGGLGSLLIKAGMGVGLKIGIDVGMDTIGALLGDLAAGNPITLGSIAAGALVALGFSGLSNASSIRQSLKPKQTQLIDAAGNPLGQTKGVVGKQKPLVDLDGNPLSGPKPREDGPVVLGPDGSPHSGAPPRGDAPAILGVDGKPMGSKNRPDTEAPGLLGADGKPIKQRNDDSWKLLDENGNEIRKSINAKISDDLGQLKNKFDDLPKDIKTRAYDFFDQVKALPDRISELAHKLEGLSGDDLKNASTQVGAKIRAAVDEIVEAAGTIMEEARRIKNMDLGELAAETRKKANEAWDEIKSAIDENTAWNQARKGGIDAYDPTDIGQSIHAATNRQIDATPISGIAQKIKAKIDAKFNPVSKSAVKKNFKDQLKSLSTEYVKKKEEKASEAAQTAVDTVRDEALKTMPGTPESSPGERQEPALPSGASPDSPEVASRWANRQDSAGDAAATGPSSSTDSATDKTHEVVSGETLGSISKAYYGTASRYMEIAAANPDLISDPDHIDVGWQLKIPGVESETSPTTEPGAQATSAQQDQATTAETGTSKATAKKESPAQQRKREQKERLAKRRADRKIAAEQKKAARKLATEEIARAQKAEQAERAEAAKARAMARKAEREEAQRKADEMREALCKDQIKNGDAALKAGDSATALAYYTSAQYTDANCGAAAKMRQMGVDPDQQMKKEEERLAKLAEEAEAAKAQNVRIQDRWDPYH